MGVVIGRDEELTLVRDALDRDGRCVLVGTGGIGKSTVARVIADERRAAGAGVVWVDVEPLDDIGAVAEALSRAFGLDVLPDERAADAVRRAIVEVDGLVVLDGVEHVADGVAAMVGSWALLPTAAVLLTSRVALVDITPVVRLAPLTIAADSPLAGPAGRLLVGLVEAQGRRDEDPDALADVVLATGGLPLAVELAARQIARFGAAFAGRRGGLDIGDGEDVIDRSLDRTLTQLAPRTRSVFAALGYTAEATEVELIAGLAGCATDEAVTALGELVDHGLAFVSGDRIDLLPPVRDRAARLASGEDPLPGIIEWAAAAAVGDGRDEPGSYRLFDAHVNTFLHLAWQGVRAVGASGVSTDIGVITARYLNALYTPLSARMHVRELMELYTQLFAAIDATGAMIPPDVEAHSARYAAMATAEGATIAAADTWLDRAERAAARVDRPELLLGRIWSIRSVLAVEVGDLARAERVAHQAIEASSIGGEPFYVEQSRWHLAEVAIQRGRLDAAERHVEEVVSWGRGNSTHHEYVGTTFLGWIAVERGDRAGVAAIARSLRARLAGHVGYDTQVTVEADLLLLTVEPSRLAEIPAWEGDATWWLRLAQRVRRAGALPIADHWESVMHTAADVVVLADTVPMMQPRLSAGLLLGDAALAGEDHLQARMAYVQVLRDGIRRGYRLRVADALDGIAVLAGRTGHDEMAGQALGLADHLREQSGAQPWVRPSLPDRWTSPRPWPSEWASTDHAGVALVAADHIERTLARRAPSVVETSLTRAERQVARLVADGLSNAEIARELVVSRRTVESHLARVFRKLGIRNRTQLARLSLGDNGV